MAVSRQPNNEKSSQHTIMKNLILTFLIVCLVAVSIFSIQLIRRVYIFYPISGTSMSPTLTEKDMVLVKKKDRILRYDVIVFSVEGEKGNFVKRVIGMPGDTIFIRNDRMILNIGENGDFETTYTFQLSPAVSEEFQSVTKIPEGLFFTIGDQVDVSTDSRMFGFVQERKIDGTVQFHLPTLIAAKVKNE